MRNRSTLTSTLPSLLPALFAGFMTCAQAGEVEQCPAELNFKESVETPGASWQAFEGRQKRSYIGVAFSDGSPTQQVTLAPDEEKKTRRGIISTWKFPPSRAGYWVSCLYAETGAGVTRKLPADAESCVVEYERERPKSALLIKSWRCNARKAK